MNLQELEKREEIAERELSERLQVEKDIEFKYEALEQRRREAFKSDNWEKETALLDKEKESLVRQLERARSLAADSKAKFSEIKELREKTEKEEALKLQGYLKKEYQDECESICINSPSFVNAIGDRIAELCEMVGRFQLDIVRVAPQNPASLQTMEKAKLTFVYRINELILGKGLLPLAEQNASFFEICAYIKPDPRFLAENPGITKSIPFISYGKWLRERWIEQKTQEWRKEQGL